MKNMIKYLLFVLSGVSKEYDPIVFKISKPFADMTNKEAKEYFNWYVSIKEERIEKFINYFNRKLNVDKSLFDYSEESLLVLWDCFLKAHILEKTPKKIIKEIYKEKNYFNKDYTYEMAKNEYSHRFSALTEFILFDIAFYVGDVFIKNNTDLIWKCKIERSKTAFCNMPVIANKKVGKEDINHEMVFPPHWMIKGQANRVFAEETTKEDLYNLYQIWKDDKIGVPKYRKEKKR